MLKASNKLVREWVDIHVGDLEEDWLLAKDNHDIKKIDPLK